MVDRTDIRHLLNARRSLSSFGHALRLLSGYAVDRLRHHRGRRLVMGNALAGRLFHSLLKSRAHIALSASATSLRRSQERVDGLALTIKGERAEVAARAGVILATGGFSNHPGLRKALMPGTLFPSSSVLESAAGDGLALAEKVGGRLCPEHESNSFWAPVSSRRRVDGSTAVFPHFVLDRGKPGILAVDPTGNRFVNEATTYHLFGEAMFSALDDAGDSGCHLVCDDAFVEKYGLGMVRPNRLGLRGAVRDGYVAKAETLDELARRIGVPTDSLTATVSRHNSFAQTGVDEDFGKGEGAYQRNLGDPAHTPNPCVGTVAKPLFYALELFPGDIGASAGLVTDSFARVVDEHHEPVAGLYACGNDMESIMAGHYPGPGITIGPAMTFGYVAARHAFESSCGSAADSRNDGR